MTKILTSPYVINSQINIKNGNRWKSTFVIVEKYRAVLVLLLFVRDLGQGLEKEWNCSLSLISQNMVILSEPIWPQMIPFHLKPGQALEPYINWPMPIPLPLTDLHWYSPARCQSSCHSQLYLYFKCCHLMKWWHYFLRMSWSINT